VAGALGGDVTVTNLDMNDPQGDRRIVDVLRTAGADVKVNDGNITVHKGSLKGCRIDMSPIPDLFPITAILLSTAEGDSELHGAPQLKYKESNRIETVVNMIRALGGDAEPTDEGCIIHGCPKLSGGYIEHKGDHRVMMSAAVASIVCEKPVTMDDAECCNISFPGFPEKMRDIGLTCEEI
jgi:3-phosphoshikimate 1-carboxyvinyltransferase